VPLNPQVIVTSEHRPWRTDWSLAKIVFELFKTVVPSPYEMYFREAVLAVRGFLERRECRDDGKEGVGNLKYSELPEVQAEKRHTIDILLTPKKFEWALTFFGTARWTYSISVSPIRAPMQ